MTTDTTGKPCPRCLLADMEEERPLYQLIQEYLASIPAEGRAAEALYARRLGSCAECDRLISGTCSLCGCYVEVRAAKRRQRCPHTPAKW